MCAYENHHFHIIISLKVCCYTKSLPWLLPLVQEALGECRCKYDLDLFLL